MSVEFTAPQPNPTTVGEPNSFTFTVYAADAEGNVDDRPDRLIFNSDKMTATLAHQNKDGTYAKPTTHKTEMTDGGLAINGVFLDLDRNGVPDTDIQFALKTPEPFGSSVTLVETIDGGKKSYNISSISDALNDCCTNIASPEIQDIIEQWYIDSNDPMQNADDQQFMYETMMKAVTIADTADTFTAKAYLESKLGENETLNPPSPSHMKLDQYTVITNDTYTGLDLNDDGKPDVVRNVRMMVTTGIPLDATWTVDVPPTHARRVIGL